MKHYIVSGKAYSYEYDEAGNIAAIQNPDGTAVTYEYDALNQLIAETYHASLVEGGGTANAVTEGVSYTYDTRGNILSKTTTDADGVETTVTYAYTDSVWADRLTNFNGTAIEYDEIGNPLNWHSGATMTWQHGRQLASFNRGVYRVSYGYNQDGIRTSKTVNGFLYTYEVVDGTLRRFSAGGNTLEFINGTSVIFNGTEYWYVFNAQNDVIGIIDANGTYVVEYTYDAWGQILSKTGSMASTLGYLNPFRYRGYIYDEETGLYYCQSRYYDPAVGRWLNADKYVFTNLGSVGYNVFVYCNNNPVSRYDPNGCGWLSDILDGIGDFFNSFTSDYSSMGTPSSAGSVDNDVPYRGEPGSHVVSPDGTKERVYGPDGLPQKDRHHTDHGHSKDHPYVPHDHDWGYNEKGDWTIDHKGYPSPPGPLVPVMPSVSIDFDWEMPSFYFPNPYTGDDSFGAKVKEFFISIFG